MEVDIVVKRDNSAKLGLTPKPSNSIPTNREKDDGHVELEGLGGALGRGDTVAHDMEDGSIAVLDELPGEEAGANGEPERENPNALPVVLDEVVE